MKRRLFSLLLTGAMLLSMCPPGLALEADTGSLCPHHTEHSYEVCGYVEAVEGQSCGFVCRICPVQALLDALPAPEDITPDNAEDAAARFAAIDEASETLTEEERAALDFTRYKAVMLALAALMDDTPTLLATESGITYLDWDDSQKKLVEKTYAGNAMAVDSSATTWGAADGKEHWYVVQEDETVTFDNRITVTGNVHLILADGSTLNAGKGINISQEGSNSLTIYAQSENESMGALIATGDTRWAGIKCSTGQALTINGGNVTAKGGTGCAGIGGGDGGTITINGGTVIATGGAFSAGIGGGDDHSGGAIIINGGTVEAIGVTGIGGGNSGSGGEITISGGSVTATGNTGIGGGGGGDGGKILIQGGATYVRAEGAYGAGIGGGSGARVSGAGGNITIEGGTVIATGGKNSAGIGGTSGMIGNGWDHAAGKGGTITITGGTVTATGGEGAPDIGGGNGTTGIADTDKIEIGPGATVKNGSGGEPNYGPAHGPDTSKWASDGSQHWHPCRIDNCTYATHVYEQENHTVDTQT